MDDRHSHNSAAKDTVYKLNTASDLADVMSPVANVNREIDISTVTRVQKELETSPIMRAMREIENSPIFRAQRELENNPVLRAMREVENSPVLKAMREIESSAVGRVLKEIDVPAVNIASTVIDLPGNAITVMDTSPVLKTIQHQLAVANKINAEQLRNELTLGVIQHGIDRTFSRDIDRAFERYEQPMLIPRMPKPEDPAKAIARGLQIRQDEKLEQQRRRRRAERLCDTFVL
jgi:DNA-directed RNA polymerase subunit K/omega